jgi:uncharacterized tellurite resistance protein B-like protein
MLRDLTREERLLLLQFVCAFAWSDLEVQDQERAFITRLVRRLKLHADELAMVEGWLESGVPAEAVDPNRVPRAHRQLFLKIVNDVIHADGQVDPDEALDFALFQKLLA